MSEKLITTVPHSVAVGDNYYIFVNDDGILKQVDIDILSKFITTMTWAMLSQKPFEEIDDTEFIVTADKLTIKGYHKHDNQDILDKFSLNESGELAYDGNTIGDYTLPIATSEMIGGVKPDGTTITVDEDGTIHGANTYELPTATTVTLGGVKVDGDTIKINDGIISADVIGNWSAGTSYPVGYFVVYGGKLYQCINANSDTEWTESNWTPIGSAEGIGIKNWSASTLYKVGDLVINDTSIYQCNTEHTSVETFDETESTNWTALSGERGEKGDDGFSPIANVEQTETGCTVTVIDKNGTTTANLTNGTDGMDGISPVVNVTQTESGCIITITDSSETTTADLTNGVDGTTPHIDSETNHWFIGEIDTGVSATASIDDTSTDGIDVTWSASKISSVIGDINTILASVTGGVE